MLSYDEVVRLNQELGDVEVLSVYLHADVADPAERHVWRIRLDGMMKELEASLADAPAEERKAVHAAAEFLATELNEHDGVLPGRGWAGFASTERLLHAGGLPAPVRDLVRWEKGVHVAPYLRALKQSRPVTTVISDHRRARIYSYLHAELNETRQFDADLPVSDGSAAGSSSRAGARSGARGESRSDAARRSEHAATQRMLREVESVVSAAATDGHLVVLGGNSDTTSAILRGLPDRVRERTIELSGVTVDAPNAELRAAIESAASTLSLQLQQTLVEQVIDTTRSAGRASLGRERTERALEAGAVDTLLLTRSFVNAEPDLAEHLVDLTFDQGATVVEIGGDAATELDREGGIGARLRYSV